MATLKKPKSLKLPKAPKSNASSEILKKHLSKVSEIQKKNKENIAAYTKEVKAREELKKQIAKTKSK